MTLATENGHCIAIEATHGRSATDNGDCVADDATEATLTTLLNGWLGSTAMPANKGMKLTKPSILKLRSLSLVFDGRL